MSWDCGECGAKLWDAVPRCPYCDVAEIAALKEQLEEARAEIERLRLAIYDAGRTP